MYEYVLYSLHYVQVPLIYYFLLLLHTVGMPEDFINSLEKVNQWQMLFIYNYILPIRPVGLSFLLTAVQTTQILSLVYICFDIGITNFSSFWKLTQKLISALSNVTILIINFCPPSLFFEHHLLLPDLMVQLKSIVCLVVLFTLGSWRVLIKKST